MYAALLKNELVLAVSEAAKVQLNPNYLNQEIYRCPRCKKRVILVVSQRSAAFFKHFRPYQEGQGEQDEHRRSKLLLQAALTAAGMPAEVEVPLADGALRADVLASPNLAFEVQCAPLSDEEYHHRHSLYRCIGITDIWLVGRRHYLGQQLKKTQLIYFRQNSAWECYYLEIDPKRSQIRLKHHILEAPISSRLNYQTASFNLDANGIDLLWHFQPSVRTVFGKNWEKEEKIWLEKQFREKSRLGYRIAGQMYEKGYTIETLPAAAFSTWRIPGTTSWLEQFLAK